MLQQFRRARWTSVAFLVSLAFLVAGFLWAYFALRGIPQPLILHFNEAQGITWRGSMLHLAAIAAGAALALLMNLLVAFELEKKDWFWGKLVAGATLFMSFLLFWYFWVMVSVN
jgi:hypothetical protein